MSPQETSSVQHNQSPASGPFTYEPLDPATDTIRLLQIQPSLSNDAVISCEISHESLSSKNYTCLSYTWRPADPQHSILLNGSAFTVGDNLHHFLTAARAAGKTDLLWIDAICINQKDDVEKSDQVRRMGEIYLEADTTLIWLGPLTEELRMCLVILTALTRDMYLTQVDPNSSVAKCLGREELPESRARIIDGKLYAYRSLLNDEVPRLLSLAYWTRMWIAQELLLSSTPVLFFEGDEITFDHVAHTLRQLNIIRGVPSDSVIMDYIEWRYMRLHGFWTTNIPTNRSLPLSSLLYHYSSAGCFDERDRIYALLDIAADGHMIKPDYTVDKMSLFRTVLKLLMPGRTLDALLDLCATLLQALRIQPPTPINGFDYEKNPSFKIPIDNAKAVGVPVWSHAILHIADADNSPSTTKESYLCTYVPIVDAEDVHVFEYAVADLGDEVIVKYARTHEYLQGAPQIYGTPLNRTDEGVFLWLESPSEEMFYHDMIGLSALGDKEQHTQPALWSWTSPHFTLSPVNGSSRETYSNDHLSPMSDTHVEMTRQLTPSPRTISRINTISSSEMFQRASWFGSAHAHLFDQIRSQCDTSGDPSLCRFVPRVADVKLTAPTPRSSTFRLEPEKGELLGDHNGKRTMLI